MMNDLQVPYDEESLQRVYRMANRALKILEEQAAGYTKLTMPVHLSIDLENKRNEVLRLKKSLDEKNIFETQTSWKSTKKEASPDETIDLKDQMGKLVIENLNLFQDKAFIENIRGDKIMSQNTKSGIEIKFGDNAHISGDFIVAKSIENSFNKVASSSLENELKELLKQLSVEVGKIIEHLPEHGGKDIIEDLETLIDKTTCEKPKRKYWSVSIDGLTKAAENLGKIGAPVLELIGKIVPFLIRISV